MINPLMRYYQDGDRLFKMMEYLRGREVCVMNPKFEQKATGKVVCTRNLSLKNLSNLFFLFDYIKVYKTGQVTQLYYSLLKYRDMPMYFNGTDRKVFSRYWRRNYLNQATAYDMMIDIDAVDVRWMEPAKEDAILVYEYMKALGIDPEIRFSGLGFHIVVPYDQAKTLFDDKKIEAGTKDSLNKAYNGFVEKNLHNKITELIDLSVYDYRRIIKVPYSLAFYSYDDAYICSPLSIDELYSFRREDYKYEVMER